MCPVETNKMSSSGQKFLVALRNKLESKKTRNIYPRKQYNELLAKIKLLESSKNRNVFKWPKLLYFKPESAQI
jgi:plasmid maintenance system killer protein